MIKFSFADTLNITVSGKALSRSARNFIESAFQQFPPPLSAPKHSIEVRVEDRKVVRGGLVRLGKDALYGNRFLALPSGHVFSRDEETTIISIPSRVKRGRIKFKRATPGRHIVDEVLEPFMISVLEQYSISCYHAAAYLDDEGVAQVNVAWRNTGKTSSILKYLNSDRVMSDDLAFIDESQGQLFAYPRPVRVYSYNLKQLEVPRRVALILRVKASITPPWRPVAYMRLKPRVIKTNRFVKVYLNELFAGKTTLPDRDMERKLRLITAYETSHFFKMVVMLRIAGILA